MKNKAFTLIEMIGVITLLAVILLVSLPSLTKTLQNNKDKDYQNYLNDLYIATENFVVVKADLFPDLNYDNRAVFINISELIENGYVEADKKNPQTKTAINPNSTIKVIKGTDQMYKYQYYEENISTNGHIKNSLLVQFDGYSMINNNKIKNLADNNDVTVFEAKNDNNLISFDGINDYIKIDNVNYNNSKAMTIEFTGSIDMNSLGLIFESSINSNANSGSYYIDTNEYGVKDITLAVKFDTNAVRNHKKVENILDGNVVNNYTVIFDSTKPYDTYISIYVNGIKQTVSNCDSVSTGNLSDRTMVDYPLYVASRAGSSLFTKMKLGSLRIYNRSLTEEEIKNNYLIDKARFNIGE